MRRVTKLICIVLVGLAVSCTSTEHHGRGVPIPATTPYDMDQFARTAYLDGFERGYRAQISGAVPNVDTLTGPYPQALRSGYYAGAAQAKAEMEAAAKKKK